MATGSVLSVNVLPSGGFVDITFENLGLGGTYDLGLGAGNDPATGSPKIVFTVTSQGFTNGVLGTRVRTIYGTTWVRKPFSVSGDEFTKQESLSGSDVTVRIALSESIYDSDNNTGGTGGNSGVVPTVTIAAGFYTQGGTPNLAATNFAVTNNSTLAYPRVVGNWSRALNFEKVGSTIRLAATVFHGHAQVHPTTGSGQQVDSVKFIAADASGNSRTVGVMGATIDATYGDAVPVIEHIADINLADFTPSPANQGDVGTFNFIAYPFIGNGASVLDTAGTTSGSTAGTGTAAAPSPYYGPLSFVSDPAGTYCPMCAVVDATSGVDSGNTITGADTSAAAANSHPFLTIAAAFTALRTYINSTYGRNNCGGATIFLKDNAGGVNNYAWLGGTVTAGTRPACALTVTRYPNHLRSNVVINAQSGGRSLGEILKVVELKLTAENASGIFDMGTTTSYLACDQCEIDSPTANRPLFFRIGVWHTTRCLMKNFRQGWTNYGANNASPGICRGHTIDPIATSLGSCNAFVTLGNLKTNTIAFLCGNPLTGSGLNSQNLVFAYNRLTASNTSGPLLIGATNTNAHGSAYVQNVLENCNNSSPVLQIAADGTNTHANNIILFNNDIIGQRCSMCYNEYGARPYDRLNWFVKNNVCDDYNIKGDTFAGSTATATRIFSAGTVTVTVTQNNHQYLDGDLVYIRSATPAAYQTTGAVVSASTANTFQFTFAAGSDPGAITAMVVAPHPARIGNLPVVYGVNHSGNIWAETTGIGAAGVFMQSFTGLKCLPAVTTGEPPQVTTNAATYLKFVDRKSFNGSVNGAGNGDYRLQADSPAVGLARDWVLPFDIAGVARRAGGASGAYESSSVGGLLLRRRRVR
jgi:hypothetical protein